MQQRPVLIILCILCIHVQKSGHEDLLFHSQMIRPVVAEGVANHSPLSTLHSTRYCRRRVVSPYSLSFFCSVLNPIPNSFAALCRLPRLRSNACRTA